MTGLRVLGVVGAAYVGLVALLWVVQRRLIYFPAGPVPPVERVLPGAEEVLFPTADGLALRGWFLPARGAPVATAVVFNGNAGNRSHRATLAAGLSRRGIGVLLVDYRGYGGNPGSPSEAGLLADARGARRYLETRSEVDPARVVLFGESLGAAVAVAVAAEAPPAALVLRSPFASLVAVARVHYPFLPVGLVLRDRYPSLDRIRAVPVPLLVVAGERDTVIPASQSRQLFGASPAGTKRWLALPGVDHNDPALTDGAAVLDAVAAFLRETLGAPVTPRGGSCTPRPGGS